MSATAPNHGGIPHARAQPSAPLAASVWSRAQADARSLNANGHPSRMLSGGLACADLAAVLLGSASAYVLRHGVALVPLDVLSVTILAAVLTMNVLHLEGAYRQLAWTAPSAQIGRVVRAWSAVFGALLLLGYLTKTSDLYSRIWAVIWYAFALIGLMLVRILAAAWMSRRARSGQLARTVAVVELHEGDAAPACRLLRRSPEQPRLLGVFTERPGRSGVADLLALARLFRIDDVVVALPEHTAAELDGVLRRLGTIPTNVHLCPRVPSFGIAPREVTTMAGLPVLTIYRRPFDGWNSVLKRIEDLLLGGVLFCAAAPIMLLIGLAIKLDSPGPMLFRQKRLGFNNNVITVFKFRTMLHQPAQEAGVPQARRNDPRITRIGGFLRRSSLDELPQLLNVLRGDMSLVGPRPHALAHNEHYAALIDDYLSRHRVQPGITGWAQICGFRGETETLEKMQRRVEHDLHYIDNWSILLDLRIMVLTIFRIFSDKNAY